MGRQGLLGRKLVLPTSLKLIKQCCFARLPVHVLWPIYLQYPFPDTMPWNEPIRLYVELPKW